jgi:hypothetical protein
VEGCLQRIGEDNLEEERLFQDHFEDETQRDVEGISSSLALQPKPNLVFAAPVPTITFVRHQASASSSRPSNNDKP